MSDDEHTPITNVWNLHTAEIKKHHERLNMHGAKLQEIVGREGGNDGGGRMGRAESELESVQGDQRTTTQMLQQMQMEQKQNKFKLSLLWGAVTAAAVALGGLILKYGFGGIGSP